MHTFDEINDELPYITEGDKHKETIPVYSDIQVKFPGKYAKQTKGGDFVVQTLTNGRWRPLRHKDFFRDVEMKSEFDQAWLVEDILPWYLRTITSDESDVHEPTWAYGEQDAWPDGKNWVDVLGYHSITLVRTLQLIAVAEHRRYAKYEPEGGRFLLPRFLIGIACGGWTSDEANYHLKQGKPGLIKLRAEKKYQEPSFREIYKGELLV